MALNQQSDSIENYVVYENIGCGGFANVYRAHSVERGRDVAIKFIERKKMRDQQTLKRVESEVKIHSRLKHPYVLELFSFFFDESYIYLVLELCHNGDLGSFLKKQSKLPVTEDEACHYLRPVVEAILYLHKHRIIHRDLKLSNILLTKDMTVKLGDFGVATQLTQPEEQHFTMCGTPNYISPEVATRKPHGLPVDFWSIGCMLYNLVVGEPPFHSAEVRNTLEKVISVDYHLPEQISEDAKDLIRSLLQEAPKDRIDLGQILQHPFFMKRVLSSSSGFDDGVDETSADSGRDTLATLSGSLMTNTSQSLSSSESNCHPRSSASIDSFSPSQPEPTPSKVLSLARIFSGGEDAAQCLFRPSIRSSQPPELQTPVRQFIGSTRPLQQRQSLQKQKQPIQFNDGHFDNNTSTPGSGGNMHALCESCSADLGFNSPTPSPSPANNGPNSGFSGPNPSTTPNSGRSGQIAAKSSSNSARTGQILATSSSSSARTGQILTMSSSNSARTGQIPTKTGSGSSAAGSNPATAGQNPSRIGQNSATSGQNSNAAHRQRTALHGRKPTLLSHSQNTATPGPSVSQPRSTPTTPVPSHGTGEFRVEQTNQPWIQPNPGYYTPGHYQRTNRNVFSDNNISKADHLSRRLEPVFDEMEMRQQMVSPESNEGFESQPSRSTTPYSCFTDDNRFGLNLESNDQQEFFAESDGYLSGNDGTSAGKYPLQHHHSDGNLFQVDGFEGYGHPQGNYQLGRHSPLMVQKSMTLQRVREPRQTSLAQSRSRSVENLSQVDGRKGHSRWAAVSIDVDGQSQQQPKQRLVPPICALRLSPTNQKTKCAVAHILESSEVCLEFFQLCSGGKYRVCQGLLISPDGLTIKIYKLDSPLDPSLKPIPLSSSMGPCKKFLYSKLPQKYWKQYEYASRFVNLLRSETAKVILYSDRGKATLMENTPNPNFVVCFYDGAKFKVSSQETKIVQADGSSMTLQSTGSFAHLSPETQEMWHHVQTLHTVCKELDEFFTEKVSNKIPCFPIVIRGTPSTSAMMGKTVEKKKHIDANDSQPSSGQQPMSNGLPASERMVHDVNGSAGSQSRQLRSASSVNHGSRTPVKMTERQQEAFVRNQPAQLRPLSGHACTEQKSVGQPVVQPQMNSSDVQIVKEIYEPSIGKATEFSNGFIVVQHNDGSEIHLNTSLFSITFKDCQGRSRTFMKDDKLPTDIALLLTYMMEKLTNS